MASAGVEVLRVAPPKGPFRLEGTQLGLDVMKSVPVIREKEIELGIFERFLLEAAQMLGDFYSGEIAAVTGLPDETVDRGLWKLKGYGALEEALEGEGRSWRARGVVIDPILAGNARTESSRGETSLLGLPRTAEMLEIPLRSVDDLRHLQDVETDGGIPVAPALVGQRVEDWISDSFSRGRIHGMAPGTVGFPGRGKNKVMGDICPKFDVIVDFPMGGGGGVEVLVAGFRRMGGKELGARFLFPASMEQVEEWRRHALIFHDRRRVVRFLAGAGLSVDSAEAVAWDPDQGLEIRLDAAGAESMFGGDVSLTEPFGIRLEFEEHVITCRGAYVFTDPGAEVWCDADRLISLLNDSFTSGADEKDLHDLLERGRKKPGASISREVILDRAWRLGLHRMIYLLRDKSDFHYEDA